MKKNKKQLVHRWTQMNANKNKVFVERALPAVEQTFVQHAVGQCPTYQS